MWWKTHTNSVKYEYFASYCSSLNFSVSAMDFFLRFCVVTGHPSFKVWFGNKQYVPQKVTPVCPQRCRVVTSVRHRMPATSRLLNHRILRNRVRRSQSLVAGSSLTLKWPKMFQVDCCYCCCCCCGTVHIGRTALNKPFKSRLTTSEEAT